jgi:hypothetical protein
MIRHRLVVDQSLSRAPKRAPEEAVGADLCQIQNVRSEVDRLTKAKRFTVYESAANEGPY